LRLQENSSAQLNELLTSKGKVIWKFLSETLFPRSQRNYILDESASLDFKRYSVASFYEGFRKTAVLIVPSDEEWRSRRISAAKEGTTHYRSTQLMENIQRNFIPPSLELFSTIIYPELPAEKALSLLAAYGQHPVVCNEWTPTETPSLVESLGVPQQQQQPQQMYDLKISTFTTVLPHPGSNPGTPGDSHRKRKGTDTTFTQLDGGLFPVKEHGEQRLRSKQIVKNKKARPEIW